MPAGPLPSRSLDLLRTALQHCLRPLSWKVAIFEELRKLAVQSTEPGRKLRRAVRTHARTPDDGHKHLASSVGSLND